MSHELGALAVMLPSATSLGTCWLIVGLWGAKHRIQQREIVYFYLREWLIPWFSSCSAIYWYSSSSFRPSFRLSSTIIPNTSLSNTSAPVAQPMTSSQATHHQITHINTRTFSYRRMKISPMHLPVLFCHLKQLFLSNGSKKLEFRVCIELVEGTNFFCVTKTVYY